MKVSYCIPTHDGNAKCQMYLFDIFHALECQTDQRFDVWISDHSESKKVYAACEDYADVLDIKYVPNDKKRGNISANTNNALRHADGEILKVLFSDDFILTRTLNQELIQAFDNTPYQWAVTGYAHSIDEGKTHYLSLIHISEPTRPY